MNERRDADGDEAFASKAKALFDDSVEGLDAESRSRLNRARQAALAANGSRRPAWVQWLPAAGVAVAAVFAVVLWTGSRPGTVQAPATSATDFEILLNEDSLEMLEELEFYRWIELADQAGDPQDAQGNVG